MGRVSEVTALTPPKSQGASSKPRRHDTDAQPLGSPQGAMDGRMDLRCSDVHRRDPFPSLLTILPSNTYLPSDADFPGCTPCVSLANVSQPPPPASTEAAKALLRAPSPTTTSSRGTLAHSLVLLEDSSAARYLHGLTTLTRLVPPLPSASQSNVTRATTESYLPVAWTPDSLLSRWPAPPPSLSSPPAQLKSAVPQRRPLT